MGPCDDIQDLLFEHLYGLLDTAEEQKLHAHLAQCPACPAALAEAKEQQNLLASAARVYRQVPPFMAPAEESGAAESAVTANEKDLPPLVSFPASPPRRMLRRLGWLAAAAVLLSAGTLWALYQGGLERRRDDLARARGQVEQIDTRFVRAQITYQERKAALPAQVRGQFTHLQVTGPADYQADAPSPIRIKTRDVAGKPISAQVVARLVIRDKELFRAELASTGDMDWSLPAGLTVGYGKAQLVVEARTGKGSAQVQETIRLEKPALVTHLALSKAVYQVGEVLFFRTLTLRRFSLQPAEEKLVQSYALRNLQGKIVQELHGPIGAGGIGGGEFALTNDLLSGEYTLEVSAAGSVIGKRRLEIQREPAPSIHFDRQQYHPGETVYGTLKARRPAGVQAKALVDDKAVSVNGAAPGAAAQLRTDAQGNATLQFKLPAPIETGKAVLEVQLEDGKRLEKLVQPIPVAGSRLLVEFFPEGGDLVAGVPNRVYYRIRTPQGEPVNLHGSVIILSKNKIILDTEEKKGLGVFTFTPEAGDSYRLFVTYPGGLTETPDPFKGLPIRSGGVALSVPEGVSGQEPLQVLVRNTGAERRLLVLATCRGRVVAQHLFLAAQGANRLNLAPVSGTCGIVRLTVYDVAGDSLVPLAERLVYRVPAERLALSVPDLKPLHKPGQHLKLGLRALNERREPTPAWFLAAVVDDRVADFQSPSAHFLLTTQVRPQDLEDADLLLADSPAARQALDLFLGTQGWRRFAPAADPALYAKKDDRDKAGSIEPLLFSRGNDSPANLLARSASKVHESLEVLGREMIRQRQDLEAEKDRRLQEAGLAAADLADFQTRPVATLRLGVGILTLSLLVAGGLFLLTGLVRLLARSGCPRAAFTTAFCALLACLILVAARGSLPAVETGEEKNLLADLPKKLWPLPEANPLTTHPAVPRTESPVAVYAAVPPPEIASAPGTGSQGTASPRAQIAMLAKAGPAREVTVLVRAPQMAQRFSAAQKLQADKKTLSFADLTRVYSHQGSANGPPSADTLLWHPALWAADGSAQISFDLPKNATTYRIILYGNSPSGRLGAFQGKLQVSP